METPATSAATTYVARNERERLVLRFAELVQERGYANVRLADVAAESGIELETIRSYFGTERDCVLAATEVVSEQMFSAVGQAFLATRGDCPLAARAALEAMLRFFAGISAFVHLTVVEHARIGVTAVDSRRRAMDLFAEFLGPGFAVSAHEPARRQVVSILIAGGIYELVSRYYLEGRLHELPEALPAVTYFTVAPFFGLEEAQRVSALTV